MIKQTGDDLVDVMETSRKSASRELDAYIEQFDGRSSGRSSSAHSTTLVEEEDDDGSRSVPVLNLPDKRRLPASWQHRSDIRAEWRRLLDEIHSNVELGAQPEQIVTTASIMASGTASPATLSPSSPSFVSSDDDCRSQSASTSLSMQAKDISPAPSLSTICWAVSPPILKPPTTCSLPLEMLSDEWRQSLTTSADAPNDKIDRPNVERTASGRSSRLPAIVAVPQRSPVDDDDEEIVRVLQSWRPKHDFAHDHS